MKIIWLVAAMTIQPQDKYMLRLPDGMRDRIKEAAAENNRSMNAEIVATLEGAYPEPKSEEEALSDLAHELINCTQQWELDAIAYYHLQNYPKFNATSMKILRSIFDTKREVLGLPPKDILAAELPPF